MSVNANLTGPIPDAVHKLSAPRVLVLNASYEPLHVASAKRAITLVQFGVAEVLEESEDVVRSPSTTIFIPSVIRLKRYVRRPRAHPVPFNRRNVLRRDFYTCQYCGSRHELTIDHVHPRSRGGRHAWENVVAACRECNQRKGNRTPEEAGLYLKAPPRAPTFGLYVAGYFSAFHENWSKYLYG